MRAQGSGLCHTCIWDVTKRDSEDCSERQLGEAEPCQEGEDWRSPAALEAVFPGLLSELLGGGENGGSVVGTGQSGWTVAPSLCHVSEMWSKPLPLSGTTVSPRVNYSHLVQSL